MKILILKGKHEDRFFDASTEKLKFGAALAIINYHLAMSYYMGDDKKIAEKILSEEIGNLAWRFIHSRSDHEYEGLDESVIEQISI